MLRRMSRLNRGREKSGVDCGLSRGHLRPGIFEWRNVGSLQKRNWRQRRSSATATAKFTTGQIARIIRKWRRLIAIHFRVKPPRWRRGIGRRGIVREKGAERNDLPILQ